MIEPAPEAPCGPAGVNDLPFDSYAAQTYHENAEQLKALQAWVSEIPSATK